MCKTKYKHPGVLYKVALQQWEWYKLFECPEHTPHFLQMDEVIRIMTARYGINHKRYFNIVWGYIEELWLESVKQEFGVM